MSSTTTPFSGTKPCTVHNHTWNPFPHVFFKTAISRPTLKQQNQFVITTSLLAHKKKTTTFHWIFPQGTEANSCSTHFRRICTDVNSWLKCEAAKKACAWVLQIPVGRHEINRNFSIILTNESQKKTNK